MYFYPVSDLAIIPLANGKVLFKSDNIALRIDGDSTAFFVEKIIPLLDGQNGLSKVAAQVGLPEKELLPYLKDLVQHGILRQSNTPKVKSSISNASPLFENFLDSLGMPLEETQHYLKNKRIGIIGLDGIGYHLITMLIQFGIQKFKLADTFEVSPEDKSILNFIVDSSIGKKRQEVVKENLLQQFPYLEIELIENITKPDLKDFTQDCDLLIGCFDKAFVASNYWINEVAFEGKIPSLYTEIIGQKCLVGPLVIPDQTACYMCYKMRKMANSKDFDEAMSYEEYLNKQKKSNFTSRSFLPSSVYLTASLVANEAIKFLLSLDLASLKSKLIEFDVFSLQYATHAILHKPDCTVCRKKKAEGRTHPDRSTLIATNQYQGELGEYEDFLVSSQTGVVQYLGLFQKDVTEPHVPYIFRADLSNHRFLPDLKPGDGVCSGKGLTIEQAKISALGEAVERYSGAVYDREEIVYASFESLKEDKLHPRFLVLFEDSQYDHLEYARFEEQHTLGWAKAFSLVTDKNIWVPAIAVFMDYQIHAPEEYLFPVTSNGLGAGSTLLHAILAAALEVIERDAFVITWHQQLRCIRYDPFSLPLSDVVAYCKMYQRRGVVISLFKLPTDFPCHVFLAVAQQVSGEGPALVVGLGADFDPLQAAKGAIIEVGQVRPALRKRLRLEETQDRLAEILVDPQKVTDLEDHDLLYASPENLVHFDFLLQQPVVPFDLQPNDLPADEKMDLLIDHLRSIDSDLIYYNLTPPDMEKLHLFTARVLIPQLQPIHFGYPKIRLGGTRLYELPYRLGLKKEVNTFTEINLQPHPLA